jgi:CRISPR system Cascade subunit CasB
MTIMSQLDVAGAAVEPVQSKTERGAGLVEAFANEVHSLAKRERRGDLSDLRRLDVDAPSSAAFFRIVAKVTPESGPDALKRYARLLQILALKPDAMAPMSLGHAMVHAKISENRVQKLLGARGSGLAEQLRLVARRLASAGALPYRQIGELLLAPDDSDRAERLRLTIARDYWVALGRALPPESETLLGAP